MLIDANAIEWQMYNNGMLGNEQGILFPVQCMNLVFSAINNEIRSYSFLRGYLIDSVYVSRWSRWLIVKSQRGRRWYKAWKCCADSITTAMPSPTTVFVAPRRDQFLVYGVQIVVPSIFNFLPCLRGLQLYTLNSLIRMTTRSTLPGPLWKRVTVFFSIRVQWRSSKRYQSQILMAVTRYIMYTYTFAQDESFHCGVSVCFAKYECPEDSVE